MIALALALAAAPRDYDAAMERCAERVVALRHPGGMVDTTGIDFEWLQVSGTAPDWVIIGSIVETEEGARVARRFTCRMRGGKRPKVAFGKVVRSTPRSADR